MQLEREAKKPSLLCDYKRHPLLPNGIAGTNMLRSVPPVKKPHRSTVAALWLFVGSCLSVGWAADPLASRYLEDAASRLEQGDVDGAIIQLQNSLQRDPGQLAAKVMLADAYLAAGDPAAAETALKQAELLGADPALTATPLARARNLLGKYAINVETIQPNRFPRPTEMRLWVQLGIARLGMDDVAGAEIAFEQALSLNSKDAGGLLGLAQVHIANRQFDAAKRQVELALSIAPDDPETWMTMGAVYHARGEFNSAAAHYREALQRDPNHYKAALSEAMALLDAAEPEAAAPLFANIRKKWPLLLEGHYLHAKALGQMGREQDSERAMQQAADLISRASPHDLIDRPGQLLLASIVAYDTGQYEGSYGFLSQYLIQQPGDIDARKQMAVLLLDMGKPDEALKELNRLMALSPNDPQLYIMRGDTYLKLERYAEAEHAYQSALELRTPSVKLISRIGLAQQRRGRTREAISTMSRLFELAPDSTAGAPIFLGVLHFNEGDYAKAYAIAEEISTRKPDNLLALNLLAASAIASGQHAEGRRILENILTHDPEYVPATINLAKLEILDGRFDQAERIVQTLIQRSGEDARYLMVAAQLAIARGQTGTAIKVLERIRHSDGRALKPNLALAELYADSGDRAKATTVARELEQAFPTSVQPKLLLARLYAADGEVDLSRRYLATAASLAGADTRQQLSIATEQIRIGALADGLTTLEEVIRLDDEALRPRLLVAQIYARQHRLVEADALAKSLLEQHPRNPEIIALAGDIKFARGQTEDAIRFYRLGLAVSGHPGFIIGLHRSLVGSGRDNEGLLALEQWHAQHPGHPGVLRRLADHYARAGNVEAARNAYEALLTLKPDDAEIQNNLANLLMQLDSEKALQAALRAHQLAPTDAAVLDTLGWIWVQVGEIEKGIGYLRDAVSRNGRNPSIRYHLGVALHELGSLREARREFENALQIGTDFPEQSMARQRLDLLQGLMD